MNRYRRFFVVTCFLACSFGVSAQDTITFKWAAIGSVPKTFLISATNGESFTVYWGDGSSDPYTGAGSSGVNLSHNYTAGNYTVTVAAGSSDCRFTYLGCYNQSISSLDVSNCTALEELYCYNNSLSSLDVSNCTALQTLSCEINSMSSLDVSNCTALWGLYCSYNSLSSFDVSNCTALKELYCYSNSLSSLDVSNCTALVTLRCNNNHLSSLDVGNNTALEVLNCSNNSLDSLDVGNNTALEEFHCANNFIDSLDISNNTALQQLNCSNNFLINLNVNDNTALVGLNCSNNSLINLDVRNNPTLVNLFCNDNSLSSLDVRSNTMLYRLECFNNSINGLDVRNNTVLGALYCYTNHLPLSDLYAASKMISNTSGKYLGQQTLLPQTVIVGDTVDFSLQAAFGTPDTATVFIVEKGGIPADSAIDYSIENGVITFYNTGSYTVTMTNDAIESDPSYPAVVSVDITVRDINTDASLSNLTVSDGVLTPAFSSTVYIYTVNVDNSVSSVTITATPTDPNASVSGDVGIQSLSVGVNPFTVVVTAEDGTTTTPYYLFITRSTVGIDDVGTECAPSPRIYPNPTTGKFSVFSFQFSETDAKVEIYDVVGCLLQSKIVNLQSKMEIDISHLANGLYFLKVDGKTFKVVKE